MARMAGITGIEPGQMTLPVMDRPSVAFAWFLDAMKIEATDDNEGSGLVLSCEMCANLVCFIEDGDDLRVLLNTALAHTCPTPKRGGKR